MSFQYELFKLGVRALGVKGRTALPEEKLIALSRRMQAKSPFAMPRDDSEFQYADHVYDGKFHCVQIRRRAGAHARAVLYCYGGGMMMPPSARYFDYARQICRETERDVWYARYPLCSDYSMLDAVKMVMAVYRDMLEHYAPEDIAFYGFSSGGSLLVSLLLYNREQARPLPRPGKLIAIAPGGCPADAEEYREMLALDGRDIEISAKYMERMHAILEHGQQVPEYMIDGRGGDYSALPETWLYYGAEEILSVKAKRYARALADAGVPCHLVIREGMCHCYCITVKFPEARADYEEIIRVLRQ